MHVCRVAVLICAIFATAEFAFADNNVEWDGVSHIQYLDRRPICPMNGESFDVLFQVYQFDITSAAVVVNDGGLTEYAAVYLADRGPYAVWTATVPATASSSFSYYIKLTDGTDTDYYSVSGMSDGVPVDGGFVIDFSTLSHAPVGSTRVNPSGAVFKVWAPTPTTANVAGQFNGWSSTANPMTKYGDYFVAYIANANDRQQYKYVFNGSTWKPDSRAKSLNPSDSYNTHIEDRLRYNWVVDNFDTPDFEDMIIYELHVGTFSGRNDPVASGAIPGTYRDVAAHVDHFVELGVNVVELMPITEFPWDFSAGYNPVTAWAPEWKYGTPDDMKYMVDVLHQNGIAVILDIVWNHMSPTDNYLWDYDGSQIYFDSPAVDTPWGSQCDFDQQEVREYFLESALYWVDEFDLDGFRMDGTDYMNQGQPASGWSLMQDFNDELDNRAVQKIAIAEQLPDDSWITRPTSAGGAGFDSQWHDAFTDNLRQEIINAAFGSASMSTISSIIYGSGTGLQYTQVVNYLESHDEIWPSTGGQRIVKTIDTTFPHDDIYAKGRVKLAQGLVLFAPGIPMFHQGSEWLEYTDFGGGSPAGADRINWTLKTTYADIFQYFSDACWTRRDNPGFRSNAGVNVSHVNEGGDVIAFHRWDGAGNDLMVVANFSNNNYTGYQLGFPQNGTWYELVNSQATVYGGNGMGNGGSVVTTGGAYDGFAQSATMTIPQMGLLVLRYNDPPNNDCPGDLDGNGQIDLSDLAGLLSNYGVASGATPQDGDLDGDGDVDLADLAALLAVYGTSCP